jgi:BlaI family transcriptional regulator, penicillinase repressor
MREKKRRVGRPKATELSALEQDVMGVCWRLNEFTSAEVIKEFCKSRQLADTTIRTVLSKLRDKGYLELLPTTDRRYRMRPTVDRDSVARRLLRQLVSGLFDDSPQEAILYLLQDEGLRPEELDEIRGQIEARRKEMGPKRNRVKQRRPS